MAAYYKADKEENLMHNAPLWTENIRATRLPPAHSSNSINSTFPITSLSDSHDEKSEAEGGRGDIDIEEIILLLEYAISLAATVTEQHHLSREE